MRRIIIVILIFLLCLPVLGQETEATPEPSYSLETIYYSLQTIRDLEGREILSASNAQEQREFYLEQAELLTGEKLTEGEITTRLFDSGLGEWTRFITFVNIIWVFASLIIVLSCVWLFILYIVPILKRVPVIVYEVLLYLLVAAFIFGGQYANEGVGQFVAMPGVLGLIWLMPWSYARRINKTQLRDNVDRHRRALVLQNAILTLIWGGTAIYYESVLIGFLTVIALMATIGLSDVMPVLLSAIGFREKDIAPRVMIVALMLLLVFIIGESYEIEGVYRIFETGVYWIGAYAFFGALEVMASKRYHKENRSRFWRWQIISVLAGVGAIFIGVFWDIGALSEVGGTFLLFYILEKYVEIPNWHKHWAWAGLGLGLLLYGIALFINQYPEFFVLG